jgi:BMFP domain-containing protein YqiC
MAEQNELHFETIDRNKDINLQRNKLKYLEDRIATLEKSLSVNKAVANYKQMIWGYNAE